MVFDLPTHKNGAGESGMVRASRHSPRESTAWQWLSQAELAYMCGLDPRRWCMKFLFFTGT